MKNVKKLQLITLISGMTFYTPIFTLLLLQRHIDLGFIVAAQTMFTVGMLASTLPTGTLADKWGQKHTIQIGMVLDMLGMLLLIWLHTPIALIVFFTMRGIGLGFKVGADEALLYDSYAEEQGSTKGYSRAYAKMLSNDTLGFVIATAIAGLAVQFFKASSYIPLVIASALATFASFWLAHSLKNCKHHAEHLGKPSMFKQLKEGISIVKKSRTITALAVFGLLTMGGEYFLRQTYQPYFLSLAVPALFLGVALSAGKLLNFITMRNIHKLETRYKADQLLLVLSLALGAGFILLAVLNTALGVVVAFIVIQALLNAPQPIISDYINEQIPSSKRSTTLSTVSFILSIGQIIARLLLGISIGVIGLRHTFIAQGTYLLVGTVIGVWFIRRCGCFKRHGF